MGEEEGILVSTPFFLGADGEKVYKGDTIVLFNEYYDHDVSNEYEEYHPATVLSIIPIDDTLGGSQVEVRLNNGEVIVWPRISFVVPHWIKDPSIPKKQWMKVMAGQ